MRPHSFYVLVILIIIFLVIFVGGILLRPPVTPRFGPTLLERLPSDVLLLLLFLLFRVERFLLLLSIRSSYLAVGLILLHRGASMI